MNTKPTEEQIQEQADIAVDNNGKYSGLTYEDGVCAALNWVLGHNEVPPMED